MAAISHSQWKGTCSWFVLGHSYVWLTDEIVPLKNRVKKFCHFMTSLYHFMTSLCMVSSKHESTRVNESFKKLITFLIMNSTFSVNQKYERMWYVRLLWPFIYKLRSFWEKLVETYGLSTWRNHIIKLYKIMRIFYNLSWYHISHNFIVFYSVKCGFLY